MFKHYVVFKRVPLKVFIGEDAKARAFEFADNESAIWAMTEGRAAELGLRNPTTSHQIREVSMEPDVHIRSSLVS